MRDGRNRLGEIQSQERRPVSLSHTPSNTDTPALRFSRFLRDGAH